MVEKSLGKERNVDGNYGAFWYLEPSEGGERSVSLGNRPQKDERLAGDPISKKKKRTILFLSASHSLSRPSRGEWQ